jgi:hypothetical protein
MQCPECRSETPGSLGRCTRCDAVLPQSEEPSWTPQIPGGEPWPPEPWQPEQQQPAPAAPAQQQQQPWRYNPSEEERPWVPREEPRPPREEERPSWAPREEDRPWAVREESPPDEERPWAAPPENPWQAQQAQQPPSPPREQGWQPPRQPQQSQPQQQSWPDRQQQPWNAQGTPPHQQQWSARTEQRARPEPRPDAEQWLPDDAPRWRGPLIAGLAAALLTAAIVVGYVFWTKNGDDPGDSVAQPQTTSESSAPGDEPTDDSSEEPSESEEPSADGDPKAQAEAVDGLLSDMVTSRKKLSTISYTCAGKSKDISTFKAAIAERKDQLADAGSLDVGALDQGEDIKKALKAALQASIDSNEEALTWLEDENGCGGDAAARLKDVTDKATAAKKAFLNLWNPVAEAEGLDARTRETI